MGAFEGSLSFKTFYVNGEPPKDFQDTFLNLLHKHYFQPLSPVGDEQRSVGWVPTQDPIATEFRRDQVFISPYIVFSMRIDKWALPTPWVKALTNQAIAERLPQLDEEEAQLQEDEGKLRTKAKLSKAERNKIKLEVITRIKQKTLPSMKIIDVVWNYNERTVRFWSTSKAVCDEFAELFEQTFGFQIDEDSPFMMAKNLGLSEKQLDDMVNATPWQPLLDREED